MQVLGPCGVLVVSSAFLIKKIMLLYTLFIVLLEKEKLPTPVFLPEKSHGLRSLVGYSPWDRRVRHDFTTKQQQIVLYMQFCLLIPPVAFQAALTLGYCFGLHSQGRGQVEHLQLSLQEVRKLGYLWTSSPSFSR